MVLTVTSAMKYVVGSCILLCMTLAASPGIGDLGRCEGHGSVVKVIFLLGVWVEEEVVDLFVQLDIKWVFIKFGGVR